jgi:succinate dehydrogenase flavin-adding protein (antitoxin of CptAB toxin-antitoxin module)
MVDTRIIGKIDVMVTRFIDNSFDFYKEEFEEEYNKIMEGKDFGNFVEFISHDFLFCSILHGEKGGKYDIREYHSIEFKRLLGENIEAYSKIVNIVDKYFTKYPNDACQRIEEYKPDTILKYYAFVFTKLNEDLFVRRTCPKELLDDSESDMDKTSDSECEDC